MRDWAKNELANEIANKKAEEAQKTLENNSSIFFEPTRTAIMEKMQDDLNSDTSLEKILRTAFLKCHPDKNKGEGELASNNLTSELSQLKTYCEKFKEPDFFYTKNEAKEIFKPFPSELRNKIIARLQNDYPAKFPYKPPKEVAGNIHDEETSRRIVQNLTEKTGHQWVFDNQGFRCDAIYQGADWEQVASELLTEYPFINLGISVLDTLSASCNSAKDQRQLLQWSNAVDQAKREEQRKAEEELPEVEKRIMSNIIDQLGMNFTLEYVYEDVFSRIDPYNTQTANPRYTELRQKLTRMHEYCEQFKDDKKIFSPEEDQRELEGLAKDTQEKIITQLKKEYPAKFQPAPANTTEPAAEETNEAAKEAQRKAVEEFPEVEKGIMDKIEQEFDKGKPLSYLFAIAVDQINNNKRILAKDLYGGLISKLSKMDVFCSEVQKATKVFSLEEANEKLKGFPESFQKKIIGRLKHD